jgi:hypothetical protein
MRLTHEQALAHQARMGKDLRAEVGGCDKESDLHQAIIDHCSRMGFYIAHHSRMNAKSTCPEGSPDFVIFLPASKAIAIECKSATGKLSTKQLAVIAQMDRLNGPIFVVRKFEEYLAAVKAVTTTEPIKDVIL